MDSYKQAFVEEDAQMKLNMSSEKKRKRTPKGPWEPKSKDKQIVSDKPKQASGKGKRTRMCDIYNDTEDQFMCLERASMLLERLDAELPKFGKCMLPSNVLYSFWLILPKKFCVMHLPDSDTTVTLIDESGKEYKTNYLKARHGLSAGWRGFSNAQKLLQGDILFFNLVEPCKLQVNIVRRYGLETIEAATCLMEMHPRVKRTRTSNVGKEGELVKEPKKKKPKRKKAKKEKTAGSKKDKLEPKEEPGQLMEKLPRLVVTKKGKRTHRSRKRFIVGLGLVPQLYNFPTQGEADEHGQRVSSIDLNSLDEQCDNSSEAFSSEVLEGSVSEMRNHMQAEELGSCGLNLSYHEGINCQSTTQRIYRSSTVAT